MIERGEKGIVIGGKLVPYDNPLLTPDQLRLLEETQLTDAEIKAIKDQVKKDEIRKGKLSQSPGS